MGLSAVLIVLPSLLLYSIQQRNRQTSLLELVLLGFLYVKEEENTYPNKSFRRGKPKQPPPRIPGTRGTVLCYLSVSYDKSVSAGGGDSTLDIPPLEQRIGKKGGEG